MLVGEGLELRGGLGDGGGAFEDQGCALVGVECGAVCIVVVFGGGVVVVESGCKDVFVLANLVLLVPSSKGIRASTHTQVVRFVEQCGLAGELLQRLLHLVYAIWNRLRLVLGAVLGTTQNIFQAI